ncbi:MULTISPECIES: extracellular solute-binding protein [unclassified Rhizobium]|uniref:ABC transporter substrate-binding protein n=1 Tax=unclassified Rhizobium TaxID=2613769 RepID=UPI0016113FC4|nr:MULTISPECIES: extracellular solute-binding protein [unclassified Rhizobium]MBB3318719.1 putative spermidine/putrescine transport system substrate-binding protein [Rhizobium sp. BK181]MBB3543052.1 putative spermidine/putrescine transport system substrate-binding protein [Rhizobium sp. BK399]MCS3742268.1 putative spermidine/putrescine transport system substrate-binding protein [Rhizobium sp. BK661]MCS4094904.1 putative spermidine/putrescine transport system substrate-binding protein [Rhizobium
MGGEWTKHSLLLASATAGWLAFAVATEATPLDELVAAAKAEGQLNVIGLPHDWCGYGAIIDGFKTRFGIPVIELSPDIGSTKVIDEIRNARAVSAAPAPDVIDVGHPFASSAKKEGLLQPYKVRTWATIPDAAKDADGYWAGAYYGTIAIEVNTDIIRILPTNWADLQKPAYKGAVGLAGDLGSNQAIQSIFAAGLSAAGGNHETAAELGLTFFATLHEKGNFVSLVGNLATLVDGRTPILIRWDYLAIADRERLKDKSRIEIIRPKTGVVAGVYAQAISAFAAHPNAARLWLEYLYSDETQLMFADGHCHPIRSGEMVRSGRMPKLPMPEAQSRGSGTEADPLFPTVEEQERARDVIIDRWGSVVGVTIDCDSKGTAADIPMVFNDIPVGQCSIPNP